MTAPLIAHWQRKFAKRALVYCLYGLACGAQPSAIADIGTPDGRTSGFAPETGTGFIHRPALSAKRYVAVTAHPQATQAAHEVLRKAGSAVDAAIAAQLVLTLVEPQSSGIGGGGFMLHWDAGQHRLSTFDGRETAPMAVDATHFLDENDQPLPFFDAAVGGRAVGVPGLVKMLALAHARHGKLPWSELFAPAVRLARNGFPVSPRLHALLAHDPYLKHESAAGAYFYDAAGVPHPIGHVLRNPALADTLESIARNGAQALYTKNIARDMVTAVQLHAVNPGKLTIGDLIQYQPREREPICHPYRHWMICGMGPPSSGGMTISRILSLLESTPMAAYAPRQGIPDARAIDAYAKAAQLAWSDRDAWIADPEFVNVPAALLDRHRPLGPATQTAARDFLPACMTRQPERPATTHLTIIDRDGNAVALTSSIENAFGSRVMVRGFLLNNQLTDFSFSPAGTSSDGKPCRMANRVEPGKRPRSSMAPTMVFQRLPGDRLGRLELALGSAGGPAIIHHVATRLIAMLDWRMSIDTAFALPHFIPDGRIISLENGRMAPGASGRLAMQLESLGLLLSIQDQNSGLTGIQRLEKGWRAGWRAAADPRREGVAIGE